MTLAALISSYGYLAIAVGTFFEGETILVLGGFAAHRGYLALPWVLVWAFVGTFFGDQLYFYLGRLKGRAFVERRPAWRKRAAKVFRLLERHQVLLILGFRFVYGIRTVTPFVLGASRVPVLLYLVLNAIGAAAWTLAVGLLGYLFGAAFQALLGDIRRYEIYAFIGLAAAGLVVWGIYLLRKRCESRGNR